MGRQFNTLVNGIPRKVAGWSVACALSAIGLVVVGFGWFAAVAPPLVSFAITVGAAIAWCAWLEAHPDVPPEPDRSDRTY
jgi:hypothetical protein